MADWIFKTESSGAATYKDLCSLVTDMGQTDLLYEYFDPAGHKALWSNRHGSALAASALLGSEITGDQMRSTVLLERMWL